MRSWLVILVLAAFACGGTTPAPAPVSIPVPFSAQALDAAPAPDAAPAKPATPIADGYREVAKQIIDAALAEEGGWKRLAHLTDHIGHRLAGSKELEEAIEWARKELEADGHENVRAEKVMVPHWVRGAESAELITPEKRPVVLLALGGSGATPKKGLTAEVVVVTSWPELEALGDQVKGKIVLYNVAMPAYSKEGGSGYGKAAPFRLFGPARAAKQGAVAALMRSLTGHSLRTPHTGATIFPDGQTPIPAAAITVEDSELIARYVAAGETVKLRLNLEAKTLPDAPSANVVAELRGRELPDEVVVIGGHIDSWDVGQGAHDDGGGVVVSMQALALLRKLGLTPRRTIRVVLWTNEENGIRGARAYAADHKGELAKHVAAIEMDSGVFHPTGYGVDAGEGGVAMLTDVVSLLEPLGATGVLAGYSGTDVEQMAADGVPGLALGVDGARYFDIHHTAADTLDKVAPADLRACIASMAVMAYVLADMPGTLPRLPPPKKDPP
jgi:Zn-dependent M28 family amino/carboxypeptidase